jgi:hypothetical protein
MKSPHIHYIQIYVPIVRYKIKNLPKRKAEEHGTSQLYFLGLLILVVNNTTPHVCTIIDNTMGVWWVYQHS